LDLEFGERFAGLLIIRGHAMKSATFYTGYLDDRKRSPWLDDWVDDPTAYESAVLAAKLVLEGARPEEERC
jgi:hypothetical protein